MSEGGVVLDSSAVLAVLRREDGHRRLRSRVERAEVLLIGAPTLFDTALAAIARAGGGGEALMREFLDRWRVQVLPFGRHHWPVACEAFGRYGKGRHPASLEYRDCMTYASARLAEMPLLFTGDGFAWTDIAPA
jgi:ribonuclease VapC